MFNMFLIAITLAHKYIILDEDNFIRLKYDLNLCLLKLKVKH